MKFKPRQNYPVMKPLLQGLAPNQTIQIVNAKSSGGIKIMRLNQPIGQNINAIKKLPSKIVKRESQLHQQALDVTPGLGFIKVIYPFRISLSNGYELVQRLKCNSCASAGINFSTFFPNILQNHEVSVHGKAGVHGQISLCQACNRFKHPTMSCKEMCAAKGRIKACMFCGEVFNHHLRLEPPSRLLKHHIETVHGANAMLYQCSFTDCSFESTNEIEFNSHLHFHQLSSQKNVTKFSCTLCPVACRSLAKLKAHAKVHFTTRPRVVVDCTHFARKRRLSKKINQSKCRYCNKHFNIQSNRLQHEALSHRKKVSAAKLYRKTVGVCSQRCSVCSKVFSTKVDKWNHELGVHCLKNIMWQNQTQSVREYSWTLNTGSG